jgi:hypothetical protein
MARRRKSEESHGMPETQAETPRAEGAGAPRSRGVGSPTPTVGLPKPDTSAKDVRVLVLGDVNIDTLIATLPRPTVPHAESPDGSQRKGKPMAWQSEGGGVRFRRPGGAWLLKEIIDEALSHGFGKKNVATSYPEAGDLKALEAPYLSSSAILGLYPRTGKTKLNQADEMVYRIEKLLGWVQNEWDAEEGKLEAKMDELLRDMADSLAGGEQNTTVPTILVLHDKDGYFRRAEDASSRVWDQLDRQKSFAEVPGKPSGWIVWQMYSPLAEGMRWPRFLVQVV